MIKPGEYRIITNLIEDCLMSTKKASEYISNVVSVLTETDTQVQSQSFLGLHSSATVTYSLVADEERNPPSSLRSYIIAVHSHIFKRYNLKNIDDFLEENFMEVNQGFANLSNSLNFKITRVGSKIGGWSDIDANIDDLDKRIHSGSDLSWESIGGTNSCK